MKKSNALIITSLLILLFSACVTTKSDSPENNAKPVRSKETSSVPENNGQENADIKDQDNDENPLVADSLPTGNDGPLLLGSKEYMTGPVVEFSLLFSTYFPLSGIDPGLSHYKPGEGTEWTVISEQSDEKVSIVRALLETDSNGNNWWLFKVKGNGYERDYEFLTDQDWHLLKMRYPSGSDVKVYYPSIDEDWNLSSEGVPTDNREGETVILDTFQGKLSCDHITTDQMEYWLSDKIPGHYVKTVLKKKGEIVYEARLTGTEKGYRTELGSY